VADRNSSDNSKSSRAEAQADAPDLPRERSISPPQMRTPATSAGGQEFEDLPTSMPYVHHILFSEMLIVNSASTLIPSVDVEAIVAILNAAIGSASCAGNEASHPLEATYSRDVGIDPASTLLYASSCK